MIYFMEKEIILSTKANHRYKIGLIFYCMPLISLILMFLGQFMVCSIELIHISRFMAIWGILWGFQVEKSPFFGKIKKKLSRAVIHLFGQKISEKCFGSSFFGWSPSTYDTSSPETLSFCHPWVRFEIYIITQVPLKFLSRFLGLFWRFFSRKSSDYSKSWGLTWVKPI